MPFVEADRTLFSPASDERSCGYAAERGEAASFRAWENHEKKVPFCMCEQDVMFLNKAF